MAALKLTHRPLFRAELPAASQSSHAISQEEFDREEGAYYEDYGPHLNKIARNMLDPYRDAQGMTDWTRFVLLYCSLHSKSNN